MYISETICFISVFEFIPTYIPFAITEFVIHFYHPYIFTVSVTASNSVTSIFSLDIIFTRVTIDLTTLSSKVTNFPGSFSMISYMAGRSLSDFWPLQHSVLLGVCLLHHVSDGIFHRCFPVFPYSRLRAVLFQRFRYSLL